MININEYSVDFFIINTLKWFKRLLGLLFVWEASSGKRLPKKILPTLKSQHRLSFLHAKSLLSRAFDPFDFPPFLRQICYAQKFFGFP